MQDAVREYHQIDRAGAVWAELQNAANVAKLRWELTGCSGLVTKERVMARWARRREKRVARQLGKDAGKALLEEVMRYEVRDFEARQAVQAEQKDRAATLKRVAEDPEVWQLLKTVPELYELKDHITVLSKKPLVMHFSVGPTAGLAPNEAAPPLDSVVRCRQQYSLTDEYADAWEGSHTIFNIERPLPVTHTSWCQKLSRCVCSGSNSKYSWAHGNLRRLWSRHANKTENNSGRLVVEFASSPDAMPGGRHIYLVSAKIKDRVALWRAEPIGERDFGGERMMVVKTRFMADGAPEMVSRWDMIFFCLDWNQDVRARVRICSQTVLLAGRLAPQGVGRAT